MGTDDLHKKRTAKASQKFARKSASKISLPKILIVCEGSKTEPNYFNAIINHLKLSTANVVIAGLGSNPMSVVKYAKNQQRKMIGKGAPYDEIYIVIDKDTHPDYREALDIIRNSRPPNTWIAINSVPCFEYWLLLHYTDSAQPYTCLVNNSSGAQILKELKTYIKGYEKGSNKIFHITSKFLEQNGLKLQDIIERAALVDKEAEENNTDNPSTKVYILVKRLLKLQEQMIENQNN